MSRREQRKAQTREALVSEAFRLFTERGFDGVTMDEIARAADVSRRTAFRYFPTKEALVFPMREQRFERFQQLLATASPEPTAFARVRTACLTLAGSFAEHRDLFLMQEAVVASSRALVGQDRLQEGEWEGVIAQTLQQDMEPRRARLLAAATMGVIRGALREWAMTDANEDLVALGRAAFAVLADGADT